MEETIHRCDMPARRRGSAEPVKHGVVIDDYDKPFEYSVEGEAYEIDLCDEHKEEARAQFATLISASRSVPSTNGKVAVRSALRGKSGTFTTKDVREWLKGQGLSVAESGRLPNDLIERYKQAHS